MRYAILETDDGLVVAEQPENKTLADVALEHGGVIADEQTYPTYDDAFDALTALQNEAASEAEGE